MDTLPLNATTKGNPMPGVTDQRRSGTARAETCEAMTPRGICGATATLAHDRRHGHPQRGDGVLIPICEAHRCGQCKPING